ncbi:MAG: TDE2508 family outer membrane beta-barrel protein [Treponema sp.]|uniref:TDE2508 family outer membrane beta-barrel protein n=1 Tax=Treponema sp. TaxID=166 RepID=UPI003FA28252
MQTTKKLVLIVLVLGTVFGVMFGQSIRIDPKSMTSASTQELFTTDVDDFLNVNEFANVMPSKVFGFLGYGDDGTKAIQLGFATQLKSIYIAGFFGGLPTVWESKTEPSGDKSKTTIKTTSTDAATGTFLVGFKNMGVSGSFTFKPDSGNQHVIDEYAKTDNTTAKFNTNANLKFGMNTNGPKNWVFKSYAELGVESKTNKTTNKNNGTKITNITDTSSNDLLLNAGTAFDFFQKDSVTQGFAVGLETKWILPEPKTGITIDNGKETAYTKTVGAAGNVASTYDTDKGHIIKLAPAYTIAYEPEGKFAVRAQASLPLSFDLRSEKDYDETKSASVVQPKVYTASRKHVVYTYFEPTLAAAVTYRPISKLCLSLGAGFDVPAFGWKADTTQTRNTSDGKVTKTQTTVTWNFNSNTAGGKFKASSGIAWYVTDKVTVDGSWNIAANLLNNSFKTQLQENNGTLTQDKDRFWANLNKLLVHNVSFLISFKL